MAAPKGGAPLAGLDRGTIAAARTAGVSESALHEMAKLMAAKKSRVEETGPLGLDEGLGVGTLDPDAGDLEEDEEPSPLQEGGAVENAVLQLTKIVSTLAQPKKALDLEAVLDQGSLQERCSHADVGEGFRRKSSQHLRDFGEADGQRPQLPPRGRRQWWSRSSGLALRTFQSAQLSQSCALELGIWDDLMSGNNERARARADQASIDGGSWVMSTVSPMEGMPLFQQFSKHALPSPAEAQLSALYDPRWGDLFLTALKEREASHEARRKLSLADRGGRPNVSRDDAADTGGGKAGGKGKPAKGKDKAGGGGSAGPEAQS